MGCGPFASNAYIYFAVCREFYTGNWGLPALQVLLRHLKSSTISLTRCCLADSKIPFSSFQCSKVRPVRHNPFWLRRLSALRCSIYSISYSDRSKRLTFVYQPLFLIFDLNSRRILSHIGFASRWLTTNHRVLEDASPLRFLFPASSLSDSDSCRCKLLLQGSGTTALHFTTAFDTFCELLRGNDFRWIPGKRNVDCRRANRHSGQDMELEGMGY